MIDNKPSIADTLAELEQTFDELPDWEERYSYIISLGKNLQPYPEEYRDEKYKVRGCQAQVWLYPELRDDAVHFYADSDASIVKGLISMLMTLYNNRLPEEILSAPADVAPRLGLDVHLSPSRSNGLASMMKQIKLYALAYRMTRSV